ncbi:hypothetical protein E2C01_098860 [Portunus trituberculatus]|uniref:Uncharacterized protein n=1 Tax=Portunus trituberculatus TaxID=210409 RepID=A0A5B7KF74_PORTR|nr:hypothetical protein [Portunus trituberculatus]
MMASASKTLHIHPSIHPYVFAPLSPSQPSSVLDPSLPPSNPPLTPPHPKVFPRPSRRGVLEPPPPGSQSSPSTSSLHRVHKPQTNQPLNPSLNEPPTPGSTDKRRRGTGGAGEVPMGRYIYCHFSSLVIATSNATPCQNFGVQMVMFTSLVFLLLVCVVVSCLAPSRSVSQW